MAHWLTNRGKLLLMQGQWDDAAATIIRLGLIVNTSAAVPAAMDTEAEIQDLNTVGELLALTGVDEPTGGWYTRKNLSRTNWAEDDTNNRANAAISAAVTWTAADVNGGETHIVGGFSYDATTDTNDTTRLLISVITWTTIRALNGSDLTVPTGDFFRAT